MNNLISYTPELHNSFIEPVQGTWHNSTSGQINYFAFIVTEGGLERMAGTNNTFNFMPIIQSIDKSVRDLKNDIHAQHMEFNNLTKGVNNLKSDVAVFKNDMYVVKNDVRELKQDTNNLKSDVSEMKGDIKSLFTHIDGLDKRMEYMRHSQTIGFTILGILITFFSVIVPIFQNGAK